MSATPIDRAKARQAEIDSIQRPTHADDSIPAWLDNGAHSLDGGRTWIES